MLISILVVNIVVCSIDRFPRAWRYIKAPLRYPPLGLLKEMRPQETLKTKYPLKEVTEKVKEVLHSKGYRVEMLMEEGVGRVFGQRGVINRMGVYVTHLSVLTILIGGLIGGIWGFTGGMTIVEGESSRNVSIFGTHKVITLPFDVRCDAFRVSYYPGTNTPKEYRSTITILEHGRPVLTKDIRVNHPLTYRGIKFYQASYGTISNLEGTLTLKVIPRSGEGFVVHVGAGKVSPLKDGYTLKLVAFYPDLVVGEGNQPMNRSDQLRNPAALLEVEKGGRPLYRSWVFAYFPEVHSVEGVPFRFRYISFKGLQYTGLQVSKDPGVWIVWLGCTLMVVGLAFSFFLSHRRVWVYIEDKGKRRHVLVAGNTNRSHGAFLLHFEELIKSLKRALAPGKP